MLNESSKFKATISDLIEMAKSGFFAALDQNNEAEVKFFLAGMELVFRPATNIKNALWIKFRRLRYAKSFEEPKVVCLEREILFLAAADIEQLDETVWHSTLADDDASMWPTVHVFYFSGSRAILAHDFEQYFECSVGDSGLEQQPGQQKFGGMALE